MIRQKEHGVSIIRLTFRDLVSLALRGCFAAPGLLIMRDPGKRAFRLPPACLPKDQPPSPRIARADTATLRALARNRGIRPN
jgi:hypothetical protein